MPLPNAAMKTMVLLLYSLMLQLSCGPIIKSNSIWTGSKCLQLSTVSKLYIQMHINYFLSKLQTDREKNTLAHSVFFFKYFFTLLNIINKVIVFSLLNLANGLVSVACNYDNFNHEKHRSDHSFFFSSFLHSFNDFIIIVN